MESKSLVSTIGIGSVCILIWILVIAPDLTSSPDILEITARNVGMIQFADNVGDKLSAPTKMVFDWDREVIEEKGPNVIIHTTYHYKDILTDETFWKTMLEEEVVKSSREYIDKLGYFMFPSNLEKKDYHVYDVGGTVMKYSFEGVEEIQGIEVYKFSGKVTFDVSDIYPEFTDQIFEEYSAINYIDPITGIEISFSEEFIDYAIRNDQKIVVLHAIDDSTLFSETMLVNNVKHIQTLYFVYYSLVPIIFGIITSSIFIGVFLQSRINEKRRELLIVQKNLEKERIKSLQDQLKNEKLAAIGQLAARISHDLKNPLTVLQGSISLAKIKPTTDLDEITKRSDRMERAVSRMSHQINNVLDFVKIKEPVINEVTISSIINSTLEHLELPTTITIQKEGVDYTLECDENLLEIVFVNIITNAIHAMDSSGIITVRTTEQVDHITVEIENNGPEIPKDTLEHIFEPLFTTKMTGTGLGLVSCNTIIKQHKGTITAHNDPTKFVIKIPK